MSLSSLFKLYPGFWLDEPVGNNVFSFEKRKNKCIFIPSIIKGSWQDVVLGENIVFREVVDGQEVGYAGLQHYVYIYDKGKHFFIVDNHNHIFSFWILAYQLGWMPNNTTLVHVDQHRDTREPIEYIDTSLSKISLDEAVKYTQRVLNVGNFLPPALHLGLFDRVEMVMSQKDFERPFTMDVCLDIDLDIFDPALDYIPQELKYSKLRQWIDQAKVITIATSPFFIKQTLAKKVLNRLFVDI